MSKELSDLNFNKVCRTRHVLSDIVKECFSLIKEIEISEESRTFNMYLSFFTRFTYGLESTQTLLADFHRGKTFREHSIAIVLRASLLDYLTLLYLETYKIEQRNNKEDDEINYNTELEKLLASQIRRSFNIHEEIKQSKYFDRSSFRKYVDTIYSKFSFLFDPEVQIDYNKPSKSLRFKNGFDEITNAKILSRLGQKLKNSDINFIEVHSLYDIYSKYDHFGLLTMCLKDISTDEAFENMMKAMHYMLDGLSRCIIELPNKQFIEPQYKKIINLIREIRGVFFTSFLEISNNYKDKY